MKARRHPFPAARLAFARSLLLALFLLLAQAGAVGHGVSHILDQVTGAEPVCELCLGFAPLAAGMTSPALAWTASTQLIAHDTPVPAAAPVLARLAFRSRAPPSPHG